MPDRINVKISPLFHCLIHDSRKAITGVSEDRRRAGSRERGIGGAAGAGDGEEVAVPSIISAFRSTRNFAQCNQLFVSFSLTQHRILIFIEYFITGQEHSKS